MIILITTLLPIQHVAVYHSIWTRQNLFGLLKCNRTSAKIFRKKLSYQAVHLLERSGHDLYDQLVEKVKLPFFALFVDGAIDVIMNAHLITYIIKVCCENWR